MGGRATAIPIEPTVCASVCVYRYKPQPMGMKASQQDKVRGQAVCYTHTHVHSLTSLLDSRDTARVTVDAKKKLTDEFKLF